MTSPRDTAISAIDAYAADAATTAADAAAAAQQQTDNAIIGNLQSSIVTYQSTIANLQSTVTANQSTISALQAQVAQLQAELATFRTVIYGASVGGYWSTITPGEPKQSAYTRITAGFGKLGAVRLFGSIPSYVDPNATVFLDASPTQAVIQQLAARKTISYLSTHHEPENDGGTPDQWHAEQLAAAAACAQYGQGRVRYVATLMGGTYMPTRPGTSSYTLDQWLDFDMTNVCALGSDSYQWGKSDATADTASTVLQPVIDAARKRNLHVVFGEIGARRTNPPFTPGISDNARAKYLTDAVALLDANRDVVDLACYFESDNGQANLKPWCLLPPPGQTATSPQAIAVWRAACMR